MPRNRKPVIHGDFAHDPALIEASNTAAAALNAANSAAALEAATNAANQILSGRGGRGGIGGNGDSAADAYARLAAGHPLHNHNIHRLNNVNNSNLDPAVVGMGLGVPADSNDATTVAAVAAAAAGRHIRGGGRSNGSGRGASGGVGVLGAGADIDGDINMNAGDVDIDEDEDEGLDANGKRRLKRTAITHEQRKALREWFFSQEPRPSQAKSIIWFNERYGRVISQAAISHSLHDRYKHLDFAAGAPASTYRQRSAQWPELEAILFDYLQAVEKKKGKSAFPNAVSGESLTKAAKQIWNQMPAYSGQNIPTFSNGWVSRFKGRYKSYKQYGDATSVDVKSLQALTATFPEESIYAMDETSLYWRRAPTLNIGPQDRTKISLLLCTNANGTDRLPLWSIGRQRDSRSLANVNLTAIDTHWRSNENAWLTGTIMEEWLQSFYTHIGNRPVLLLLDNFSAHIQGLAEAPPPANVKVQFLPGSSSAIIHPLDKGIIDQFKLFYRKHWIEYILQTYSKGQNPLDNVTMHDGLRWAVKSWDHDLSDDIIRYCFHDSGVIANNEKHIKQIKHNLQPKSNNIGNSNILPPPSSSSLMGGGTSGGSLVTSPLLPPQIVLEPAYNQLWQSHFLSDMIDINAFINLANEEAIGIEDFDDSNILQAVINYHLGQANDEQLDIVDGNTDPKLPGASGSNEVNVVDSDVLLPPPDQVLGYLEVVMSYLERQPFTTRAQMRAFEEIELELERRLSQQ